MTEPKKSGQVDVEDIFDRNVPHTRQILAQKTVAVAGCGGLGSNAAVALTRAGIGQLILADFDNIDIGNLNRQYYFLDQVGQKKTDALAGLLLAINPQLRVQTHFLELTPANVPRLFAQADLLIEAFDRAESKAWLIETWCTHFPAKPIVCGSGLAGYGATAALGVRRAGNIVICGDEQSDMAQGLISARVAIVANMQANEAIALLVGGQGPATAKEA
jgi:sulfur carrier protein ThiS adenylyltransferase